MNGILIIDKPQGCTSHDIVSKIRRLANEKVGHTGTLDPLAQGVLPILIGKATLCSKYLINHDKTYKFEVKLGTRTDTADGEGRVIEEKEVKSESLEKDWIEKIIKSMLGKQKQTPPIYSAIKVNGKKLYEYARKGQKVEIKPREIEIYELKLLNINKKEKILEFIVKCSKGTYIRTLCEDIAQKLGSIGYMKSLMRLTVGEFSIDNSVNLSEILEASNAKELLQKQLITIEEFFQNKQEITLNQKRLELFLNGVKISENAENDLYRIYCNGNFIGIGEVKRNQLKRDIIII